MKRLLLCATALLPLLRGQTLIDPAAARAIASRAGTTPFPCSVQALKPALSLSSRLLSGYMLRVPESGPFTVLLRITPEAGGPPAYLTERVGSLASGAFFLGEGHYSFRFLLVDDAGRSCVKDWQLEAGAGRARLAIAPNTVTDLSLRGAELAARSSGVPPRITILFEAAPIVANAPALQEPAAWNGGDRTTAGREALAAGPHSTVVLRSGDQALLLAALSALVEQFAGSEIRLIVFNLSQQKEMLRAERFTLAALPRAADALRNVQLATVDYRVLVNPSGHHDLLANLINGELRASPVSAAVVFLGPHERFADDFPGKLLDRDRRGGPPFFRLAYEMPGGPPAVGPNAITLAGIDFEDDPGGERVMRRTADIVTTTRPDRFADPVTQALRKLGGKTFPIQSPPQFTRAMERIRRQTRIGN